MKAKNFFFFYTGIIALILGLSVGFYSCDDDDDNNPIDNSLNIASFTPSTAQVGDTITITGTGFNTTGSQYNTVTFTDNITATIIEVTGTTLKVKVPEGAGDGPISITVDGEIVTSSASFTLDDSPVLESLSPVNGYVGTEVTLTGNNFGENAEAIKIYFGDSLAVVSAITNTSIVTAVPAHDPEVVEVKVILNQKTSNTLEFTIDKTPVDVRTVYWSTSSGVFRGDITNDGAEIQQLYSTSKNYGIEVDYENGYLYWVGNNSSVIYKAPIEGDTEPSVLYTSDDGFHQPQDIAIDPENNKIYIADLAMGTGYEYILAGNLNGTSDNLETLYSLQVTGMPLFLNGLKIYVSGEKLYWTESLSVKVMEGSVEGEEEEAPKVLFDSSDNLIAPYGLAINPENEKIYITDWVSSRQGGTAVDMLYVGNLSGDGNLTKVIEPGDNLYAPSDIEIDRENGFLYWINKNLTSEVDGRIMRYDIDDDEVGVLFHAQELHGITFFDLDIH